MEKQVARNKRNLKRRQKTDLMRSLRIVKDFGFHYILNGSPVEPTEGYVLSDRDDCLVFASFVFRNISEKRIRTLTVRIDFYYYQNIPYTSVVFCYSKDNMSFGIINENNKELKIAKSNKREFIEKGASFGKNVYIPLPESPFTKMRAVLEAVEYSDGSTEKLEIALNGVGKTYTSLDRITQKAYDAANIYKFQERVFPTKNLPQFGKSSWLCCCGYKNPVKYEKCEKCSREKAVQQRLLSESAIEDKKKELVSVSSNIKYHDKTRFPQNKYLENKQDKLKKAEAIKQSRERLKQLQNERRKKERAWLTKGIVILSLFWALFIGIVVFMVLIDPGKDGESFLKMVRRILEGDKSLFEFFGA